MSKKKKAQPTTTWREITWPKYVAWLQGKAVSREFSSGATVEIHFRDGSQAVITSNYQDSGCDTCGINGELPSVRVREQAPHEQT